MINNFKKSINHFDFYFKIVFGCVRIVAPAICVNRRNLRCRIIDGHDPVSLCIYSFRGNGPNLSQRIHSLSKRAEWIPLEHKKLQSHVY
jgi:hypothetical protein